MKKILFFAILLLGAVILNLMIEAMFLVSIAIVTAASIGMGYELAKKREKIWGIFTFTLASMMLFYGVVYAVATSCGAVFFPNAPSIMQGELPVYAVMYLAGALMGISFKTVQPPNTKQS